MPDGKKYLTVDVARSGQDKSTFFYWNGLNIYRIDHWGKNTTKEVREKKFGQNLPSDYKTQAKQKRFLKSRGFSFDEINKAFSR